MRELTVAICFIAMLSSCEKESLVEKEINDVSKAISSEVSGEDLSEYVSGFYLKTYYDVSNYPSSLQNYTEQDDFTGVNLSDATGYLQEGVEGSGSVLVDKTSYSWYHVEDELVVSNPLADNYVYSPRLIAPDTSSVDIAGDGVIAEYTLGYHFQFDAPNSVSTVDAFYFDSSENTYTPILNSTLVDSLVWHIELIDELTGVDFSIEVSQDLGQVGFGQFNFGSSNQVTGVNCDWRQPTSISNYGYYVTGHKNGQALVNYPRCTTTRVNPSPIAPNRTSGYCDYSKSIYLFDKIIDKKYRGRGYVNGVFVPKIPRRVYQSVKPKS